MRHSDNEEKRLEELRRYKILDTLAEEEYDELTSLASQLCGAKVSLISLIDRDRQWFKSQVGWDLGVRQTTRDLAFCSHTILDPDRPLVVRDARVDERFRHNQLVTDDPNIVFYAGMPLVTQEGYALGSLCVIDHEPRDLSAEQLAALEKLARQVVRLFELRRAVDRSHKLLREREAAYNVLRDFSYVIAHDLKAPVRNISQAGEFLAEDYGDLLPEDGTALIGMIQQRASDASRMIEGVLKYSKAAHTLRIENNRVIVRDIIEQAVRQVEVPAGCAVEYVGEIETLHTSRIAMLQIFQNLIGNALKFNDKESCSVRISSHLDADEGYVFAVQDNGRGIPPQHLEAVFRLFHSAVSDNDAMRGHGVGLSIVKRLVEALGGTIRIASEEGLGSTFTFTIADH
ncbi:sensor histidine kinase [Neolewinella xylanilytica]|uniref:sensor histidine kinase n=1 Tax=Neolewinella xylanilytica TaxID=1514080 RepID=UPI0014767672|nr:ATP-binding protein [Neolewinella xylanilytica]